MICLLLQHKKKDQEIEVAKVASKAILDEQKTKIEEGKQGFKEGIDLAREFVSNE